ncbi:MAG TPA: YihY/virulence factor BrkB family protein [Candidatus Sulfotelmatobacter sp.]|nr:YihY/virulence factor BrkB family protein [Candidatus Sulfotelmatobacter sp.]
MTDPAKQRSWWQLPLRVFEKLVANHASMLAAGVAFWVFLALFPALVALVSLYGLIADPVAIQRHLDALAGVLPEVALGVLTDQLKSITAHSNTTLSFTLVFSLAFSWWSASSALKAIMEALNVAYGERDRRGLLRFNLEALLLTLGSMGMTILALVGVVAVPIVLRFVDALGLPRELGDLLALVRWPILAGFVLVGLAVLFRFGPGRARPKWRLISWGSVVTTALWLLGSALFSFYVSRFNTYDRTYGSLAAVVVLLLWLYGSALVVILGAQLDAEIEALRRDAVSSG